MQTQRQSSTTGRTAFGLLLSMFAMLVGFLSGSPSSHGLDLVPASESPILVNGIGVNVLRFGGPDYGYSLHNVFFERFGKPNSSLDYLRSVGASLDLYGHEFWSLAEYGEHYRSQSELERVAVTIPQSYDPNMPPPGFAIPTATFYLAMTQVNYSIFPPYENSYSYGWVQLQLASPLRSSGSQTPSNDLILLDWAFTGDERGIIIGRNQVVPEPSGGALGAIAVAGLLAVRRRPVRA